MRSKNDKAKYDMDYQKSKMTRVTVWFNLDKDKDIISWLDKSKASKSEIIKKALRNEMNRSEDSVERHIKYTKKIKLNARRHNVKFRSIQII